MTKNIYFSLLLSAVATVSFAEETRQVDKHEHGVGELNIAIDKNIIDFEFMLPGADIVGFEYEAKSEEDLAVVSNALEKFKDYKNAIFIDIGCGMSGLAGTVETDRPYFGSRINYRIKDYDYSNVDPTNFNINIDNSVLI